MGIGNPVEIYDRIYMDDYYDMPKGLPKSLYLPEVTIYGGKQKSIRDFLGKLNFSKSKEKKALGGNLFDIGGPQNPPVRTTGGAGYIPPVDFSSVTEDIANIYKYLKNYFSNRLSEKDRSAFIDLSNKNVSRIKRDTKGVETILTNEFVEDNDNTIKTKKQFKNTTDTLLGDKKIPLSKISTFYGIEDGKLKAGSLDDFKDETVVIPNRAKNVGKVVKVIAPLKDERKKSYKIFRDSVSSSVDAYNKERGYKPSFLTKLGYLAAFQKPSPFATLHDNTDPKEYRHVTDSISNIYRPILDKTQLKVINEKGDTISGYSLNATPKALFANEQGNAVFVSDLHDNERQLNDWLKENPSYPIMVDNGRYGNFMLSGPNIGEYIGFGNPDKAFVLGTTKKSLGGNLYPEGGSVDDFLLHLLNNVAQNPIDDYKNKNVAAKGGNIYLEGGPNNEYGEISSTTNNKPVTGNTRKVEKAPVDITPIDLATMYANNVRNGNKMIDTLMLRKIDNYMISKNVGLPQRQSLLYTIQQEGNTIKPHGNGAYGLVGWRGERAKNLPITLAGQMEKLYNEVFGDFNADNWHHGGKGSGYMTGRDAQNAFINAKTIEEATKALNYGYVRPPLEDRIYRTQTSGGVFKKKKSFGGNLYPKGGSLNPNVDRAMKYFMDKGFTDYQAAGIVGNLMRESSMNPDAVNKSSGAYGLLQWLGPRKKNLFKMYGEHPTFDQQLDYLWHELNTTHKKGLNLVLASPDAPTAADKFFGNGAFLAGTERAIDEMNKYGQDGEGALRKGIDFAMGIMGQKAQPIEYVPQKQLPPNFNISQNWENPIPMLNVDSNMSRPIMMPQQFYAKDEIKTPDIIPVREPNFLDRYNNLRKILSLFDIDLA